MNRTPLHWAVMCGHSTAVSVLTAEGANVTLPDSEGYTALHKCAMNGNLEVRMLISFDGN